MTGEQWEGLTEGVEKLRDVSLNYQPSCTLSLRRDG
jgi:hypothetical protein